MMTLPELIHRLKTVKNLSAYARAAGVNRATAQRTRDGKHAPNMRTFEKLVVAISALPKRGRD